MDKKWAERLMGKGVEGGDGFRWSFFGLYSIIKLKRAVCWHDSFKY